jgi:hypothetical protein
MHLIEYKWSSGKGVFFFFFSFFLEPLMTSSEVCKQYRRWAKAQRKSYRIMLSKQLYSCSEYIITVVENISRGVEILKNICFHGVIWIFTTFSETNFLGAQTKVDRGAQDLSLSRAE